MKKIIDVCCGGRAFWFDKNNPDVEFLFSSGTKLKFLFLKYCICLENNHFSVTQAVNE